MTYQQSKRAARFKDHTAILIGAIIAAAIAIAGPCNGQTITRADDGNFVAEKAAQVAAHDSTTTFTFTDAKGAYYVPRWSKTGNYYRQYLPKN